MNAQWQPIPGYEGIYEVSSDGQVRRMAGSPKCGQTRLIKTVVNPRTGYVQVSLWTGCGKTHRLHCLVAAAFLGPRPDGLDVDHIDGNKLNNCASNLRYLSRSENIISAIDMGLNPHRGEHHPLAKLSDEQVRVIRSLWHSGTTGVALAARFGISRAQVSRIVNGTRWRGNPAANPWREEFPTEVQR